MVGRKQVLEELEKIFLFNYFDLEGSKAVKLASNRGSFMRNKGTRGPPSNFTAGVQARRQGKIASSFQLQKKSAAGHILKLTVDCPPVP